MKKLMTIVACLVVFGVCTQMTGCATGGRAAAFKAKR
jgi:hypothetical protein